jgi:hypothetical protein
MKRLLFVLLAVLCAAMVVYGASQYDLQETRANGAII